jgi:hypothetical protein
VLLSGSGRNRTGPDVAKGDSIEGGARYRPDRVESINEDVPRACDWDVAGDSVDLAFGVKEICIYMQFFFSLKS